MFFPSLCVGKLPEGLGLKTAKHTKLRNVAEF